MYATSPDRKKNKKVTFSDTVKVRLIVEQQFEYYEHLIQQAFYFIFHILLAEWNSGFLKWKVVTLVP